MAPTLAAVRARVESDLGDPDLQALIDEAVAAVVDRFGPDAADGAITVTLDGGLRGLDLVRPLDTAETVVVVEHLGSVPDAQPDDWAGEVLEDTSTTLSASDYRVRHGGRRLERLFTGPNSRARWGTRVDVTYTPVDDQARRDEVITKLVILSVQYEGVVERKVGDVTTTYALRSSGGQSAGTIFSDERERLLQSLAPRAGLFLR